MVIYLRKLHQGYGYIINFELHEELSKLSDEERKEYELELKQENERKYNGFKEWEVTYSKFLANLEKRLKKNKRQFD